MPASLLFTALSFQAGELTAAVLDVGQGQSVLLRLRQTSWPWWTAAGTDQDDAGDTAADYLQALGRDRLDLLVLTHFHDDHANGVPELLRRLEVDAHRPP